VLVDLLKQVLNFFEVIDVVGGIVIDRLRIFDGLSDFNFYHISILGIDVDWSFAHVARVVNHLWSLLWIVNCDVLWQGRLALSSRKCSRYLENLCTISKTNIEEHCFENHRMRMVEHEMKN